MGKNLNFETGVQSKLRSTSEKVRSQLWVKSAGRCQYPGCNEPLWLDSLTMSEMNAGYIAHIVADSPKGPRGDKVRSPLLANDLNNLMLLCGKHHKLIDVDAREYHTEELLLEMKADHEKRVKIQTSIHPKNKTEVIAYQANVGPNQMPISQSKIRQALIGKYYPNNESDLFLGAFNSESMDHDEHFWQTEKNNLQRQFDKRVKPGISDRTIDHISLFAFAPQPLLIYLGSLFSSEIPDMETYQFHRDTQSWEWTNDDDLQEVILNEPKEYHGKIALLFSLSSEVSRERIENIFDEPVSIWEITIKDPNPKFLKSRNQLYRIKDRMRKALDRINTCHPGKDSIHVFPVMPIAAALEFGRVLMPKAHKPLKIYDQNKLKNGFAFALELNNHKETYKDEAS